MSSSWASISGALILFVVLGGGLGAWSQVHRFASQAGTKEHARVVISHALPKLDASHVKATVVAANYGPGESSPPHTHPCAVIGVMF